MLVANSSPEKGLTRNSRAPASIARRRLSASPWTLIMMIGVVGSRDRKSTRLNSSHVAISYAVFCLKKKKRDKFDVLEKYLRVCADDLPRVDGAAFDRRLEQQ